MARTNSKLISEIQWTINIFGLALLILGIIAMLVTIMVDIETIKLEKEAISQGSKIIEILFPPSLTTGIYGVVLGLILVLIGGVWSKQRSLWIPLLIIGVLLVIETIIWRMIPMLYSPYSTGITIKQLLFISLWVSPGLICIVEGLLLRRFGKRPEKQTA